MEDRLYRLLYPMRVYLVTSGVYPIEYNVMTAAWVTVVSGKPFLVAVSISPERYTYKLMKKYGEFTIAVPLIDQLKELWIAGRISGPGKLSKLKLSFAKGVKVNSPIVREAVANLECKILESKLYGDHELFIGEVVYTHYNPNIYTPEGPSSKANFVLHLGKNKFTTNSSEVYKIEDDR
ncbi:flavin reductase family protein [Thermogladius sp. 4427co]|uniref:flavin reductase family protein n=1 Tax=Thermogladius sp. 4427co TaxID=3450718 RepID=UPI003F7A7610